MRRIDVRPYHVFEHRGVKFVYDCEKMVFLRVEDVAYECLEELLKHDHPEDPRAALVRRLPADTVDAALADIRRLQAEEGLLCGPVTTYDDQDYERLIRRLLRKSTGNIELYLAEACNMRCKYCYVDGHNALDRGLMPEDVALAAVDLVFRRAKSVPTMQITFFGGEPLMNKPVLKSVIAYSQKRAKAEDKTIRYSLTTNGTLLDDEIIGLIRRYNFGLMISMDGPPDVQDDQRPMADGRGSFNLAARKVRRLMRRRRSVTVRCTVSRLHLDLPRIVAFLEDFGFTRVGLAYCTGTSSKLGEFDIHPEDRPKLDAAYDGLFDRWLDKVRRGEPLKNDPFGRNLRRVG